MIKDQITRAGSQRALLAFLWGLVLLTLFVFQIFWTGKGLLLFQVILAGLGAAWILYKPHWGVLIILTVWLVGIDPIGIRYLSVPYMVSAVLIVPLALSVLRDRRIWVWRVPQVKIFLAIGILLLVSIWWNDFRHLTTFIPPVDATVREMQLFVTRLVFLIFFLYFITTRRRIELTAWLVLGLIVAAAVTASLRFVAGGGAERAQAAFSLATNENRLAFICLFGTSLLWFYRSYGQTGRLKALTLPFLFFLPVISLATGSRSGFLQLIVLTAFILKGQQGWPAARRVRSFVLLGSLSFLLWAAVPTAQFLRATNFYPTLVVTGQSSLQSRINRVRVLLEIAASNPIFGIGIGNFYWMHQAGVGVRPNPHNSYLWALSSGGIGVLVLYLLLFYITYRMLKQLERAGPRELLWLSKGLRVNLILFLVFTAFADFWLNYFLYLIVGLTVAMTRLWQDQDQKLAPIRHPSRPVPA